MDVAAYREWLRVAAQTRARNLAASVGLGLAIASGMRPAALLFVCVVSGVACDSSDPPAPDGSSSGEDSGGEQDDGEQDDAGPDATESPPEVWSSYRCEVRDGLVIENVGEPNQFQFAPGHFAGGWPHDEPPQGFPDANPLWAKLDDERWVLFWRQNTPPEMFPDTDYTLPSYFAFVDAENRLIVGPTELGAWRGQVAFPQLIATSQDGSIAVAYAAHDAQLTTELGTLLIDAQGQLQGVHEYPYAEKFLALKATAEGDFLMLVEKRLSGWGVRQIFGAQIVAAHLSAASELREEPEPVAESSFLGSVPVVDLIPLGDGYLATWEEHDPPSPTAPSGPRIKFRELDAEARPLGDTLQLLPEPEEPFQTLLSWASFQDQLALLWTENARGYADLNYRSDDDRFRFVLVSPHDWSRSNAIEIQKADGVYLPALLVSEDEPLAGAIWVQARASASAMEHPDLPYSPVYLAAPVPVDCVPCRSDEPECSGSPPLAPSEPRSPPERFPEGPLPEADPSYACEAGGGEQLEAELWEPADWPSIPAIYDQAWPAPRAVPADLPIDVDEEELMGFRMLNVTRDTRALFWRLRDRGKWGPTTWYFAAIDADNEILTPPREAWYGTSPTHIAISKAGHIAVGCTVPEEQDATLLLDATLLFDVRGELLQRQTHYGAQLAALSSTDGDGFAVLMRRTFLSRRVPGVLRTEWLSVLTFATLSAKHGFREERQPVLEPLTLDRVFGMVKVENGYLIGWQEVYFEDGSRSGAGTRFLRLDARGRASGDVLDLLPDVGGLEQGQLSWVRFGGALAALWVVGDEPYVDPSDTDLTWPVPSERYQFVLLSARDLTPRSPLIELPRSPEVGDPRLFVEDGEIKVFAHAAKYGGAAYGLTEHLPTTPVAISCVEE